MIFFPNTEIELWRPIFKGSENVYGEDTVEYVHDRDVICDFQAGKHAEYEESYGEIIQDTYFVYLDPTEKVDQDMIVRIKGEDDTYKIVGSPVYSTQFSFTSHLELTLTKHRQPVLNKSTSNDSKGDEDTD